MKNCIYILFLFTFFATKAQEQDSLSYKKKVLETTEVSLISSFYKQDGTHAATSGGIGTEELDDITSTIIVSLPLNDNDVLTVDAGISAYSSASSSNINPFDVKTGASENGYDDSTQQQASPWIESSGESASDLYAYTNVSYSHSSDDRNKIFSVSGGFSTEYDYFSLNVGLGYAHLFNEKNTELSINASAYFDKWKLIYPTELISYLNVNGDLSQGFFQGIPIRPSRNYNPDSFTLIDDDKRNSYAVSLGFSQILSPKVQLSIFGDVVYQEGLLSTPFHRVYFSDRDDYFIDDYQLADDREVLPSSRTKIPIGMRLNAYISDWLGLRTYYRYYSDDWGMTSHTASVELPLKVSQTITLSPMYRYYTQTAVDYFKPYEQHLSTNEFYTSDYDLSDFSAHQYGGGLKIQPPFGIWNFSEKSYLKTIELRYQHYKRDIEFNADIISLLFDFSF